MIFLKKLIIIQIIVLLGIPLNTFAQQKKYSIDQKEVKTKHHFHISFKHLFHASADHKAKKAQRKDDKKKRKANKRYIKGKHKYWKKADHPKEAGQDRRVYRRMKKNEKRAIRQQNGKNPDPFLKRLFKKKKKKTGTVKSSE